MKRLLKHTATINLMVNVAFAVGNSVIGFASHSWWFVTLGAYYLILTIARFAVLRIQHRSNGDIELQRFSTKVTGILLVILSVCLIGIIVLSTVKDRGTIFHEIVMITIAVYAFTKVTLAIIRLVQSKRVTAPVTKALRNISLADALVSIYSLQRSMLVSFPGMAERDIQLFNILTGTAVWLFFLLLGINLIGGRCVTMAKSKLVKAGEKIADSVVDGYKKIEQGVVEGYKKIEHGVVDGYTKIEDKFVDAYLTKDGETVEEAKARLKNQNK